jgi:RNA polymerase sigma factor (sigma-70 family)
VAADERRRRGLTAPGAVERALRDQAPRVLAAMLRRRGDFDRCEDAVQEALVEAHLAWREVPERPFGWLLTVAERRFVDGVRSDVARARREERHAALEPPAAEAVEDDDGGDDTLDLLLLCCHPSLSAESQVALALRAVGGLTTAEIARALLVSESALAQRIVRAKARLRGVPFGEPPAVERGPRLAAVLHVLYLIFTEGHVASGGPVLVRDDLAAEALRLTRRVHETLPGDGEVQSLLALMLLAVARRDSRTAADGALVPLGEQDRARWDAEAIAEGTALVEDALARGPAGPYGLQAAIAALHAEAPDAGATDWAQILGLYDLLERIAPNPVVSLNRAVALGEVEGPRAGLAAIAGLDGELRHADRHRLDAVRGYLFARAGDTVAAARAYCRAADGAPTAAERRHLAARAAEQDALAVDQPSSSAPPRSSSSNCSRPPTP